MAKGVDIEIARLDEDQVRAKIAIFFGVASFFVEHAKSKSPSGKFGFIARHLRQVA